MGNIETSCTMPKEFSEMVRQGLLGNIEKARHYIIPA